MIVIWKEGESGEGYFTFPPTPPNKQVDLYDGYICGMKYTQARPLRTRGPLSKTTENQRSPQFIESSSPQISWSFQKWKCEVGPTSLSSLLLQYLLYIFTIKVYTCSSASDYPITTIAKMEYTPLHGEQRWPLWGGRRWASHSLFTNTTASTPL